MTAKLAQFEVDHIPILFRLSCWVFCSTNKSGIIGVLLPVFLGCKVIGVRVITVLVSTIVLRHYYDVMLLDIQDVSNNIPAQIFQRRGFGKPIGAEDG